jgi:murein DD-endopeptidase MepM/ murein hydrolase activator NlpD
MRGLIITGLVGVTLVACGGGSSGSDPAVQSDFCDQQAFAPPPESEYVLPWDVGVSYTMFQGNCSQLGGHRDTFAYDFDLGMGDPVLASRAGTVIIVNDQFSDDDHVEGHENNVFVQHDDGSVVRYTHLMQGSATVSLDQSVLPGDLLGLSGNSGNSAGPHLHFQAFRDRSSFDKSNAIPITFRNALGRTEPNGELIEGVRYEADAFLAISATN